MWWLRTTDTVILLIEEHLDFPYNARHTDDDNGGAKTKLIQKIIDRITVSIFIMTCLLFYHNTN